MKLLQFVFCVLAAIASASDQDPFPCRRFLSYKGGSSTSASTTRGWVAELLVLSDSDLEGTWIRLFFDDLPTELRTVDDSWEVILKQDKQISMNNGTEPKFYLIKNPDQHLRAGVPINLKISMKNERDIPPALIGYRLNGRTLCPEKPDRSFNYFVNDFRSNVDFLSSRLSSLQLQSNCGTVSSKNHPSSWPWYAEIQFKAEGPMSHSCAASLISPNSLLTAAHCVTFKNSQVVISPNSLQIVFTGGGLSDVAYIRVHPGYEWKSLNNDIAVVRLLRDVESTYDDVRPICLTDEVSDGSGVIIGREFDAHGKRGNKLVKKAAKAVSHAECVGNHPEFAGFLTDASFCGKYTEEDTACVGESGNGFQILREGVKPVWALKGIVTYGPALQDTYACNQSSGIVLTDLTKYSQWIKMMVL